MRYLSSRGYLFGPFLSPADPGGALPPDDSDIDKMEELGDAGKQALRVERQARRDAARAVAAADQKLADIQKQLDTLTQERTAREAADRQKAEDAATQAGEHERLATQYKGERDQARTDLATMTAERDALRTASLDIVKTDFDALPEPIRDLYTGADDDVLAKLSYLPKAKKAAEATATTTDDAAAAIAAGTPPDPKKAGVSPTVTPEADAAAKAQNRARYS